MRRFAIAAVSAILFFPLDAAAAPASGKETATPSLKEALAKLKIPPPWVATTPVPWDVKKPWKEGRQEIRRLLGLGGDAARQGVKLTLLYAQKGDIGDGHELPMYLYLSGNYAWALKEYEKHLQHVAGKGPTHAYLSLASCYAHFGEHAKALAVLNRAMNDLPPKPWRIANRANVNNRLGDLYVKMGDTAKARQHYEEAKRLYPTSDQPWGRHLLHRHVAKVQTKLDLMAMRSLRSVRLRDGTYRGKSLGYADRKELEVTVTIRSGRIADVQVRHEEKIDLDATSIIPKRIVERQDLKVDAVTGATVTSQAIVDGAFQALKQAGLR